jgi:hypothetical protein
LVSDSVLIAASFDSMKKPIAIFAVSQAPHLMWTFF